MASPRLLNVPGTCTGDSRYLRGGCGKDPVSPPEPADGAEGGTGPTPVPPVPRCRSIHSIIAWIRSSLTRCASAVCSSSMPISHSSGLPNPAGCFSAPQLLPYFCSQPCIVFSLTPTRHAARAALTRLGIVHHHPIHYC